MQMNILSVAERYEEHRTIHNHSIGFSMALYVSSFSFFIHLFLHAHPHKHQSHDRSHGHRSHSSFPQTYITPSSHGHQPHPRPTATHLITRDDRDDCLEDLVEQRDLGRLAKVREKHDDELREGIDSVVPACGQGNTQMVRFCSVLFRVR